MEELLGTTWVKIFEQSNGSLILKANPPKYTILAVSDVALSRSFAKREDLLGKPAFEVFKTDGSDANDLILIAQQVLNKIIETKKPIEISHPYYNLKFKQNRNSEEIFLFTRAVPILNGNEVEYIVTYSTDITEQVKARQQAVESETHLLDIILQAPLAIAVCKGEDLLIETINQKMLEIVGNLADVVGKPMQQVLPHWGEKGLIGLLNNVYATRTPYYGNEVKIKIFRDDRETEGYYNIVYYPIKEVSKSDKRILILLIDVTAEVESKLHLKENEERLLMAAEISGFSSFDIDMRTRSIIYSPQQASIFGYDKDHTITYELIAQSIHPEDYLSVVLPAYQEALKTGKLECQTRILWPDGSVHWINVKGRLILDNQIPLRIIVTAIDITRAVEEETRKNDFIAMVSHELKTPLTSVKAYIQLVIELVHNGEDPFILNSMLRAEAQTNKMVSMIQGFLDIARLEKGTLRMNKEYFEMHKVIEDIAGEVQYITQSHQIELKLLKNIYVHTDKEKIGQVLNNLLSNAIKYSPPGSKVTVGCEAMGDILKVYVSDEGIGISKIDQEKLFDRFYRVEHEKMKTVAGFGIGLYLASQIIQSHQGRIEVISTEGKGSTFFFNLPIVEVPKSFAEIPS